MQTPQTVRTYLWDPSEPVATRILQMTLWANNTAGETLYYTHDLQKNVTALFGQAVERRAQYEYDPYGNPINTTGDAAALNPYRYSSEYHDEDLGLIYYNYRHYNPQDGRWINRDPIAEQGGVNLYAFVGNNYLCYYDWLGNDRRPRQGGFAFQGWTTKTDQSEDGNFKDRAGGRDNKNVGLGYTGIDLLNHLVELTKDNCCIKDYRIAGHGWRAYWGWKSGIPSSSKEEENGFVKTKLDFVDKWGQSMADINDLKLYMDRKEILFCKQCTISIFACRIDKGFIQALAAQTKCRVTGAGGACRRRVDGAGWETNADRPDDSGEFWTSDAGSEPYPSGKYHIPVLFKNK